mmetsp:Transcript_123116/g.213580  ORF Transcript_123116/g.213580 Transcript_123116/m.213580 type:complete len:98 (-) Transcript_123116:546-839(-)
MCSLLEDDTGANVVVVCPRLCVGVPADGNALASERRTAGLPGSGGAMHGADGPTAAGAVGPEEVGDGAVAVRGGVQGPSVGESPCTGWVLEAATAAT